MAFTRYNQAAQYNPINTYVPIPFEEMLAAGMLKDRQYSENQAAQDAFYTGIKDTSVHPADEPVYQEKMKALDSGLQDLIKSNPDVGSYDFKRNLDKLISEQSRDTEWRMMKYNASKAKDLEKALEKAKSEENTSANLYELEKAISDFRQKGSRGTGFLGDYSAYKYTDYNEPMEKMGQNFVKEGRHSGLYNPDFTLKSTVSREEVPVAEVASTYGFDVNSKTGQLEFKYVPPTFSRSAAGQQLYREAKYMADQTGKDPDEIFKALYASKAATLVGKYSGGIAKYDQDLTSVGADKLKNPYVDMEATGKATGLNLEDTQNTKGVVKGWEPTWIGGKLRQGLSLVANAVTGVAGMESYPEEKVNDFVNAITGNKANESNYEFKAMKNQLINERPELKNNPRELQKAILDKVEKFSKQGVEYKVALPDPRDKEAMANLNRQASLLFGGAADNGKIEADKISGQAVQRKVYDPTEPNSEKTLLELAGKGQTVQYTGKLKNDNPYAPGLHQIIIDGKPYMVEGTEEETMRNAFDWGLYDYKRHPSGVGNWVLGDNGMEIRSHRWVNPKTKQAEVFLQYKKEGAPDSQAVSTHAVPEGTELFPFFKEQVLSKK